MKLKKLTALAGTFMVAGLASATMINPGSNLQTGLDNITQDGSFYDIHTEQYNPDEIWEVTASGGSVTRLVFEFAGFENQASFGVYDLSNPFNQLEIFSGLDCGTADTSCAPQGNYELLFDGAGGVFSSIAIDPVSGTPTGFNSATFSSDQFGYYLDSGQGTFYSQSALNGDSDGDGVDDDHMVTFAGNGSERLDINGGTDFKEFASGEFILAWEDLVLSGSDRDYSDFVVMVESVTSVAEPATLGLLGLGVAGLVASRRRQKGLTA